MPGPFVAGAFVMPPLKQYTFCFNVKILFASNISMIKQESSWQRVMYYLEVGINYYFKKLSRFIDQEDRIYTKKGIKSLLYIAR